MRIANKVIGESTITFRWADETETLVDVGGFTEELMKRAALHGLSQKLGDSYSGATSVDEAKRMFQEVLDTLNGGDWNRKGGATTGGIVVEALVRIKGEDFDVILAKWNEKTEAEQKIIAKHPEVVQAVAEIRAERFAARAKDAAPLVL